MTKERNYFKDEYINHNGPHFNENLARLIVTDMWHEDAKGFHVEGEVVTPMDSRSLLDGFEPNKIEKMQWDAYVAANAFMHDLSSTGLPKDAVMKAAKAFWFHDEDSEDGCHKVFRYFFG